jgi:serine phosphatase RsbU (regulator of sigma subunit)
MSGAVGRVGSGMRWWYRFARSEGPGARSERSGVRSAGLVWLVVPLLLIVTIPIADHFLPPDVHLAHLLVVALALTAAIAGPGITALVGGLAVVALIIAGADRQTLTTESVLVEIGSLVLLSVLLVAFSSFRARRHRELMRVRRVSDATQGVLLRPLPKRAGPVSIASAYRAFDEDSKIGGDLYAVTRTRGSTRLVIGDVRGKGLASISDNAAMLGAFRALAHRQLPLPELATYLEGAVRWDAMENAGSAIDTGERFVTAVLADIPDHEPVVHLISCGHPAPLLLHGTAATALEVPEPAPPLGLGWLSRKPYVSATFPFGEDDRLLLYTDGVTETRDRKGAFYPLAERVAAWTDEPPAQMVAAITDDLLAYAAAPLKDDMALVVVRREEPPVPSR